MNEEYPMPTTFTFGMSLNALEAEDYKLNVSAQARKPNDGSPLGQAGTEFNFMDIIMVRGGYNIGHDVAKFYPISFENFPKLEKQMDTVKSLMVNTFFKIFSDFYPNFDIYQPNLKVSDIEVNYMTNKAKYRFHNSNRGSERTTGTPGDHFDRRIRGGDRAERLEHEHLFPADRRRA